MGALGEAYILKSLPPLRAPVGDYDPPWGPWERHTSSKVLYMETLHGQDSGERALENLWAAGRKSSVESVLIREI